MIFNLMKPVPVQDESTGPVGVGDYSGTTDGLIGYAWCLGKAVPVYTAPDTTGKVPNAQYARFYFSELPTFTAEDYSYATKHGQGLLRLTESDFLAIMREGSFETVGDFPFLALLYRTDAPLYYSPYGYSGIASGDDRAYWLSNYAADSASSFHAPAGGEYFDLYLSGGSSYGSANVCLQPTRRHQGCETWYQASGITVKCTKGGTSLTPSNVGEYLVLTETPTR